MVKQEKVPSKATENKATGGISRGTQSREASSKFIGRIPELSGTTFNIVVMKKTDTFEDAKLNVAQYLAKDMKRDGDMRYTIMEMNEFFIPRPTRPSRPIGNGPDGALNESQQDDYDFDSDMYKQDIKSYVVRSDHLQENMQMAYSIFLGQCTTIIKVHIKSRPEWPAIKDTMNVLGLLRLIPLIMYSFEGKKISITQSST